MYWIGLTGGIGAGKSTVARLLAAHGAAVVDADVLAREAVAPGSEGLAEVVAAFGSDVLTADGSLDRKALAAKVFSDPEQLDRLNAIVHPRVRALTHEWADALPEDAIAVHDIPLLVEVGAAADYDLVVVVEASEQARVERLMSARNMSADEARSRIAAQADPARRLAVADVVIDNDGPAEHLLAQVEQLWARVLASR